MPEVPPVQMTICMGSSCYLRGNNRNVEVVQGYLKEHRPPPEVKLSGHLCQGHCTLGPNVTINDKTFHEVDPISVIGLLNHHLAGENHPWTT